uniref:InsB n=1 Tax=Klebsiella pneumoniae CG43 TaxID=1244085 RepID=Q6U5Y4_KLEPN|nr:InsB [Klebsiella pneumoniae CG43]
MPMWRSSANSTSNGGRQQSPVALALVRVQHENRWCAGLYFWATDRCNLQCAAGSAHTV